MPGAVRQPGRSRRERSDPQKKATAKRQGQLYTYFIAVKEPFPPSQTARGGGRGGCQSSSDPPHRAPHPQSIQSSELLPLLRGWTPEATSRDQAVSLRRGREPGRAGAPRPRETARPAEPGGGGASGRALLSGAGPGRPVCATIGRGPRTGG